MKRTLHYKILLLILVCLSFRINAATTLLSPTINNGGFESGNAGWTRDNAGGAAADKWFTGTATFFAGAKSAYISNDAGTTNAYTGATARVQHISRPITFPAGETSITLSFKWKTDGEGAFSDWDNLKVFVSSTTPTAGTENAVADQVGDVWYNFEPTWQTATITLPASLAGTTANLIFQWKCDGLDAYDPPAAIDDVTLITDVAVPSIGCTSNTDLYPTVTYTPTCVGTQETITSAGYATEYSMVNVVSGTTYTFSTDISTDYLTIANGSGGTPVYAYGTTPVAWTATFTGVVRVYNNTNSSCGTNTSIRYRYVQCGTPPTAPPNDNCANATAFPAIPTDGSCSSLTNQTTVAATNSNVTPTGSCTSNSGTPDDDVWFEFVATSSTIILNASWVSGSTDVYWQVFSSGCGSSMTSILCTDTDAGATLTGLSLGQTYYIRLYTYSSGVSTVQNICLQTTPANDNCALAKAFPIIPADGSCASLLSQTTIGTTNSSVSPTGACTNNPGTANDDVWFSFVATASDLVLSSSWVSGETDIYFQVFSSACGASMVAILCTDNDGGGIISGLTIGQTYYVRMYTYTNGAFYTTQNLCIYNPCPSGTPANDLPCNAVNIPLGSIASGNNSCSFNSGEPATAPSCWDGYRSNTVWFSFTAASTTAKVRTAPGTLRETQIAIYSGTCGSSMSLVACNNNAPDCGGTTLDISELSLTGLSVGTKYYIAVDGNYDSTGTFAITVVDGASSYPATSGQECITPITVCNSIIDVGDPGYQGIGFTCDQNNTNTSGPNCTTGERGSAWYKIIIDNPGTLYFNIIPNDYSPSGFAGDETDYDFLLWKINGTSSTTCSAINTNECANTKACNCSYLGVTGLAPGGNTPPTYGSGFDDAYEAGVTVVAGDIYLLAVQNFSNSTSGFTLDFTSTAAGIVNYGTPASVTWTGGANTTSWTTSVNWGGCAIPACGINAIVSPSSSFQPRITAAMGTVVVKNLTIDPGATLTLGPNSVIKICESLFNNGTIIADPTSTILFSDDNIAHSLNGTLSGSSSLGNLLITDVAGSTNCTVTTNTNLELTGNFTTSSATSIFNLNGKDLSIAGNLTNASGATTFTNTANSTITFKGTSAQTYSPNQNASTPILTLNNVVMNHTGTGVSISTTNTPNMVLGTSGTLTLSQGKIITPTNQEVIVNNTTTTAVTTGNTSSYVEGNLRRYLAASATGSFDFPVGHATTGYERINIDFTSAASASAINLLARFDTWGGAWTIPGNPGWTECSVTYNAPYLNNGYWSVDASAASTGNYNTTLYNRGYSNAQTAWSIAKSPSASPAWVLNGTCVAGSPVNAVQRNAMSGFSKFATVQYSITLPVELVSFTGTKQQEDILLKWITASEKNSDYFVVEKSADGTNFSPIGNVTAAGNSNKVLNYSLIDNNPLIGENYYRLKQVDKDGTFDYSAIVRINFSNTKSFVNNIHPNPVNDNIYFDYYALDEDKLQIKIYDYLGRVLIDENKSVNIGKTTVHTDMSGLTKGVYILKINTAKTDYTFTQKIIKQ